MVNLQIRHNLREKNILPWEGIGVSGEVSLFAILLILSSAQIAAKAGFSPTPPNYGKISIKKLLNIFLAKLNTFNKISCILL